MNNWVKSIYDDLFDFKSRGKLLEENSTFQEKQEHTKGRVEVIRRYIKHVENTIMKINLELNAIEKSKSKRKNHKTNTL